MLRSSAAAELGSAESDPALSQLSLVDGALVHLILAVPDAASERRQRLEREGHDQLREAREPTKRVLTDAQVRYARFCFAKDDIPGDGATGDAAEGVGALGNDDAPEP